MQWPCQDASLDTAVGIRFTVLASKLYYAVGQKQVQIANDPPPAISQAQQPAMSGPKQRAQHKASYTSSLRSHTVVA